MLNDTVDDGEMVDHAGWEVDIDDNTPQSDRRSDNGSDSAGPLNHSRESDDSNLAGDFEEYMYGFTQGNATTEGNDDPYLEAVDAMELDESQPGYLPASDDTEQLRDSLESVQIGPEGAEDLDPSEVELFPRAGKIKHPELPRDALGSHFERMYEETHGNPFHPFRGAAEFELIKWLNDMPLSKVDSFLQLEWVSHV